MIELGLGVLVFGGAVLIFHRKISAGVMLLLAASTVTGLLSRVALYVSGSSASRDFVRAGIEAAIILLAVFLSMRKPVTTNRAASIIDWLVLANFVFSTLCTFNLFFVSSGITLAGWRWTCVPMLLYFVARRMGDPEWLHNRFLQLLLVLLVLQTAYALYQAVVGLPAFDAYWYAVNPDMTEGEFTIQGGSFVGGRPRYPAMFVSYGQFSYLLAFMLLWILFTPINTRELRRKKLWAILLTTVCVLITAERVAVGMILVGVATWFTLNLVRRVGFPAVVVSLILFCVLLITAASIVDLESIAWDRETAVQKRLLELANPLQASTVRWRVEEQWPLLLPLVAQNPLGYGLGSFQTSRLNQLGGGFELFTSPHNTYLQMALETGVVGLGLFVWLIAYYLQVTLKASQMLTTPPPMARNSMITLLPILALGLFNPIQPPLTLFMWFSMGLTVSWVAKLTNRRHREQVVQIQRPLQFAGAA